MRRLSLVVGVGGVALAAWYAEAAEAAGIERIAAYAGTWHVTIEHLASASEAARTETSTLKNVCWHSEQYFSCNQIVDGKSVMLIVYTYDAKMDVYTSQVIPPDGQSAHAGTLIIKGNVWTFPWKGDVEGKPADFRVVNTFTTPDTIEFRQEFSTDHTHWTVTARGHETKAS